MVDAYIIHAADEKRGALLGVCLSSKEALLRAVDYHSVGAAELGIMCRAAVPDLPPDWRPTWISVGLYKSFCQPALVAEFVVEQEASE